MKDAQDKHQGASNGQAKAFHSELARMLFEQARSTMAVGALTFCVAAAILNGAVDNTTLFSWLAFGLFSQAVRMPLFFAMARRPDGFLPVNAYAAFVALSGLAWGLLSILFWSASLSMVNQIVIVMFPMALSIAAVTSYCSSPRTYMAFVLPAQLPFVAITLSSGDTAIMPLAAPALLFLGGQMVLFRRFHAQISDSIRLQSLNQALVEDLSRQNDQLAQARDEAEVASRAKSDFLTRVSHEFRTPINGIIGPLQLIESGALDTRQIHLLNTARESSDRLLRMVDDVVEVSSLEATTPDVREVDFSLRSLVADLMKRWAPVATNKQLSIEWSVGASVPEAILGDDSAVKRLIGHLLSNAIEFTEAGGVTVHATLDTVVSAEPRLRVTVSDTGVGIAPDRIDQIFDDFVQGADSMTRESSGTGLGLSIVRRLASTMGGSVSAVSDKGIGSTFLVLLPFTVGSIDKAQKLAPIVAPSPEFMKGKDALPQRPDARPLDAEVQEGLGAMPLENTPLDDSESEDSDSVTANSKGTPLRSGMKALVAEDNRVNQMVIEAMLDGLGCEVMVTDNGAAALDAMEKQNFDIIFMDCQMPIMDGFKATSAIRERGESVPIVAVTANALASDRDRCLSAGMNDFLTKPFASESLEQMLIRWVGTGDVLEPEAIS